MKKPAQPRAVIMLAYEGAQILDVVGPLQILAGVNDEQPKDRPAYALTILAEKRGPFVTGSGMRLVADGAYADLPKQIHTLIVCGGDVVKPLRNPLLLAAVREGAARARRVVSVCTGAFFLGAAGLLKNRRATTHWRAIEPLAKNFPDTDVERDAIYVRDGRIWTSAGVTAGMDLALALVAEDFGADMALTVARRHVLFLMRPGGQSQFSAHLAPEAYPRGKLAKLLRWIPENVRAPLGVPELAARAGMSERNFTRQFAKETGETPAAYVERARLDAARRLLTGSGLAVSEIARRAGFGSEERLRRTFQRHLKVAPAAFRARFATGEQP